jgi:SPP1 family predicted phage head-tail adaptor
MADELLQGLDLTYMRAAMKTAMPDTVNIQRQSQEADGQGGFITSWGNVYQNIPARLSSKGGRESISAERLDTQLDVTLTVAYDQSIDATDRVVHSSGTYDVQSVDSGKSWTLSKRCQMRQL